MKNYLNINYDYWDREYHSPNIESFIFRLKPYLLDKYLKKKKISALDFGCGEGANIKFFEKTYNWSIYGVDISKISIKNAQKNYSKKNRFKVISPYPNEKDEFFKRKFDLIISIQTLYYLNNEDLKIRLKSLNEMLNKGGLVFFTMMSTKNNYFTKYSNRNFDKNGMTKVDVSKDKNYSKRQKSNSHLHFINFTKNQNDLIKKFKIFKTLSVGSYDLQLESLKKSEHHYTFLGKKR